MAPLQLLTGESLKGIYSNETREATVANTGALTIHLRERA